MYVVITNKTRYLYEISLPKHNKLLKNNTIKTCRKVSKSTEYDLNLAAK